MTAIDTRCDLSDLPASQCWHCRGDDFDIAIDPTDIVPSASKPEQAMREPWRQSWQPIGRTRPATTELQTIIDDLLADYVDREHSPDDRRPLLARLDEIERRTDAPASPSEGFGGVEWTTPAPLGHVSLAYQIRSEAATLDQLARCSSRRRGWLPALISLPHTATRGGRASEALTHARRWHAAARVVLGFEIMPVQWQGATCFDCKRSTMRVRVDGANTIAWCTSKQCADARPYDLPRLMLVARDIERGRRKAATA